MNPTCSLPPGRPTPPPGRPARRACGWAALLLAGLLAGCAHAPLNAPLTRLTPTEGYRAAALLDPSPDDQLSVVLFFSGGGMRAAALSYGVLLELSRTGLPGGGRMLDRVEAISAVSGGSVPAAYYCLYGDRVFQELETTFLKRDVQGEFFRSVGSPANTLRLASSFFSRSDLAAEHYDRILFHGATFGDLLHSPTPRPFLVINAAEMDSFAHFPFTQDTFDLIGSDLSAYPIARAVAASSAIPVVMTPIT
ncbi:MAG: patatin-like phospholipase family protein [Opitutaceae bacterium]|nr:patatin-like phospholipase family protein [Opitutaceae bacterium]